MASASKLEMVNRTLRSVLLSEKGGVVIHRLQGDYCELTGEALPYKQFGYSSLEAYLKSIPNVVSLQRGPEGNLLCSGVTDVVTQRIGSLISRQKGKKIKQSGSKPKPGRSYAHPTYVHRPKPVYNNQSNPSYKPRPVRPKFQTHQPTFQSTKSAPPYGKLQKQQKWTKPSQPSTNPVYNGPARLGQQFKPPQSTYSKWMNSAESGKPKQQTTPIYYQSTTQTDSTKLPTGTSTASALSTNASKSKQPTPGAWSGKLGSKRNQQQPARSLPADDCQNQSDMNHSTELSHQPAKPVYENIYISVENDCYQPEKSPNRGKTKATKGKKQEWSSNFEVPPRFKKLVSPAGTSTVQGHHDNVIKGADIEEIFEPSADSSLSQVSQVNSGQLSPQTLTGATQISTATSNWIQTTLMEKPNGVWASALCNMYQKEFSKVLDVNVIEEMAKLNLIQKESIYNNDILYPKLTVTVKDSPASKTTRRSVAIPDKQEGVEKVGNQTENGTIERNGTPTGSSASEFQPIHNAPNGSESPSDETSREASEGWGSPTMEAPGVPSIQLPAEDEWDVYVAYIKSISDFYVILIGEDYSEQLIVLEEEMRTFYQCCTWTLTEPLEEGDCYAAEFKREWLRVEVQSVQGDQVQCLLLDHGDIETADIRSLRPLSETFLQLPFQVIHCKLSGSKQVTEDDTTVLQMFCQLALGKNLLAEVTSRDGDRVAMELFDDSDVPILEQCMAASI